MAGEPDDLTEQLLDHKGNLGGPDDGYGVRLVRPYKDSWWVQPETPLTDLSTLGPDLNVLGRPGTAAEAPEQERRQKEGEALRAATAPVLGFEPETTREVMQKFLSGKTSIQQMQAAFAGPTLQAMIEGVARQGYGLQRALYGKDWTIGDQRFLLDDVAAAPLNAGAAVLRPFFDDARFTHEGPTMAETVSALDQRHKQGQWEIGRAHV
mgnify:CR=1 FL=1